MNDVVNGGQQPVVNVLLGCDPQLNVRITETDSGTLFVVIEPAEFDKPFEDIDGIFFDLADGSSLDSLNFFPEANQGSIFSPVTSIQAAADSVNTLSNGAQVAESFDIGIQFGTSDNSTSGEVTQANFTLFGDNGPLSIDDLDLDSLSVVVNSDGGNGQVLTTDTSGDTDPAIVSTEILFEDFDDIRDPDDSEFIVRDGRWDVRDDQLFTNGSNDGTLKFAKVEAEGDVTISFDANVADASQFENGGSYGDALWLQVRTDDGSWQTLDDFRVNDEGTALVGNRTGNEIGEDSSTLTYSGGVLNDIEENVQFRIISKITANNEQVFFDNFSVVETSEVAADGDTVAGEKVTVDFDAANSGDVVSDQFEGVTISAQRAGDRDDSENDAVIFDSNSPTGRDYDLGFEGQGNIVIISEDNDSSDADDNAHGGTITFDFDAISEVQSLNLLDIEEAGGTIDLFDEAGELINTVDIPAAGDNSNQLIEINTVGVASLDVNLVGSGAVDELMYFPQVDAKGGQYDVDYVGGLPVLHPVEEEMVDDHEEDVLMEV